MARPATKTKPVYWYHTDLTARSAAAVRFENIRVDALGLSIRARNALLRHDPGMTVATLLTADEAFMRVRGLGKRWLEEIDGVVTSILGVKLPVVVPQPARPLPDSDCTRRSLPSSAADSSIGLLHLPTRTHSALVLAGLQTIGDLDNKSDDELLSIEGIGASSLVQIAKKLARLRDSIDLNHEVDWRRFWLSLGIRLIPRSNMPEMTMDDALRALPSLIREMTESRERE
jgi:DNA-directed RNA polymerase alpha subunit